MKPTTTTYLLALLAATTTLSCLFAEAILVQPNNYMLDDSSLVNQETDGGSLAPFYNDQSNEHVADKDIISIIGDRLARLRYARMLDNPEGLDSSNAGHFSQEMAELIQREQQEAANNNNGKPSNQDQSLTASVADILMNAVAQAAAQASIGSDDMINSESSAQPGQSGMSHNGQDRVPISSRGNIMELDTSSSGSSSSLPSKADLKTSSQWFNPKETIPVLKISSMATPSKYKKVYFRSEKKLVDGAFHSLPSSEQEEKKSLMKQFNSGVQRRSSRGTSAAGAPQSILQDGVIDFLKKFRDVYIQTRPVGGANNLVSAAASSPLAAVLAPSSSSGSRPNLASALSAASSMVNNAALVAQAASSSAPTGAGAASSAAAGGSSVANPIKSPLTAQSYVSFWSKTFPTWVRKTLKQLRRRSLYNSHSRRQHQQHSSHHHSATSAIGQAAQAAASGAVASVVDQAINGGSSSGQSSPSSSSSSSSSSSQSSSSH